MKSNYISWQTWIKDRHQCKRSLEIYMQKKVIKSNSLPAVEHLKKAEHNFSFANWLIERHSDIIPETFGDDENFYDWAVNAYYYSIYHMALALISAKSLSSKSHSATLCAVIYHFFHATQALEQDDIELLGNCLTEKDIETFSEAKSLRERVCYGISRKFETDMADEAKDNAKKFLQKVRLILSRQKF
ncbi:MAG: HEPN domain-containing protein [Candidatus Aenigmarchaeota archaeon]|nr:HEPN domain-containing protein [Candidatus Aenigmarchaeota archaeon]MCK5322360.1 HEPN domain-containing protein [Candidatus Aenigmarchaeota archaeon]